jgi:sulfate permease, SulP family
VPAFVELRRLHPAELALALSAAAGVLVFGVLVGVAVAVGLSIVVAVGRMARPHDAVLGEGADLDGWVDVEDGARTLPGLLVYRFDAPLFFANASRFRQRIHEVLVANPGAERWVVLDFEGVGSVDATGVEELRGTVDDLRAAGVEVVAVARANHDALAVLANAGLTGDGAPLAVFPTINAAVRAFAAG